MAKTRADLRSDVRAALFDTAGATWSDPAINDALNAALLDLSSVQREAAVADVAVTDGTGALPSDCLLLLRVVWLPTKTPLVLWAFPDTPDPDSIGTPTHYTLRGSDLVVWPEASGTVRLSYWRKTALLASDTATISMPESEVVERMAVQYAIAACKHMVGDPDWQQYDALYLRERAGYADRRLKATQAAYGTMAAEHPYPPADSPWRWL